MGGSQSTTSSRAAKFSGNGGANRRSVRAVRSAPATELNARRATSCRNTNRNVKEFSKFWSDGGNVTRSKSSNRASVKRQPGSANGGGVGGGSIRRNRTQSVDVRRTSNCLPVPSSGAPSNATSPRNNARRATSFRTNGSASTLSVNGGERRKSRSGSTCELLSPNCNSARSEVYSAEFNQAAIAAARLKRLSLAPYPVDSHQLSPHHRKPNSNHNSHTHLNSQPPTQNHHSRHQNHHHHPRPSYHQKSPETAIY